MVSTVPTTTEPTVFPWSGCRSVEAERRHRKQRLAAAFRIFSAHGFDEGVAGPITARDPGRADCFWVNQLGMDFGRIRVKDLLLVDRTGEVVAGTGQVNRAAYAIHSAVHEARPDVVAAAHSHSLHGKTFSSLGRTLEQIYQDHCDIYQYNENLDRHLGVVIVRDECDNIVSALGTTKGAILRNHGLLTVGQSVDEAAWWFVRMERCCQVTLMAEAAGTPVVIDDDAARQVYGESGSHVAGWFTFQPMYERIVEEQPDLLDE
jgi:ribulose-5-phosphate 4-epimerase/fuculose-1-phosphate aldolase